jgi:hypothetical protein
MSNYCKQCSEYYFFGKDFEDAKGISTPEDTERGLYAEILCDGCGLTLVNHNGECIDCPKNGYSGANYPRVHSLELTFGEKY